MNLQRNTLAGKKRLKRRDGKSIKSEKNKFFGILKHRNHPRCIDFYKSDFFDLHRPLEFLM